MFCRRVYREAREETGSSLPPHRASAARSKNIRENANRRAATFRPRGAGCGCECVKECHVSNPMLEPRRLVVAAAVAFAALALAAADPARGEVSVSDEQADASAVVAETLDAVRFATPDLGTKAGDATTL